MINNTPPRNNSLPLAPDCSSLKKVPRSSNLELLRLLCILWIISDHVFQGNPMQPNSDLALLSVWTLPSLSRVACTVFVLIGAYFLCESRFRFRRVFHIWWTTAFYCVLITSILYKLDLVGSRAIFESLLPVSRSPLWFCSTYILVLLMSPFLNQVLKAMTRRQHFGFLVFWSVPILIIPTLTQDCGVFRPEIWVCIYAYCFAAYMRRWQPSIFEDWRVIIGLCFIPILRIALLWFLKDTAFMTSFSSFAEFWRSMLNAVPNFATAVGIFCLFRKFHFQSKVVNKLAQSVLAIYIIHQVPTFFPHLWNGVFLASQHAGTPNQLTYTLTMIVTVFAGCAAIDMVKRWLFTDLVENNRLVLGIGRRIDGLFNGVADLSASTSLQTVTSNNHIKSIISTGVVVLGIGSFLFWTPASVRHFDHEWFAEQLPHKETAVLNAGEVSNQSADRDILTFGPYVTLTKGYYEFTISYRSPLAKHDVSGYWDISAEKGTKILDRGPLLGTLGEPSSLKMVLYIDRAQSDVEFRSYSKGAGAVFVKSIRIKRQEDHQP